MGEGTTSVLTLTGGPRRHRAVFGGGDYAMCRAILVDSARPILTS